MSCWDGRYHMHVERCYESGAVDMLEAVREVIELSPDELKRIRRRYEQEESS